MLHTKCYRAPSLGLLHCWFSCWLLFIMLNFLPNYFRYISLTLCYSHVPLVKCCCYYHFLLFIRFQHMRTFRRVFNISNTFHLRWNYKCKFSFSFESSWQWQWRSDILRHYGVCFVKNVFVWNKLQLTIWF